MLWKKGHRVLTAGIMKVQYFWSTVLNRDNKSTLRLIRVHLELLEYTLFS